MKDTTLKSKLESIVRAGKPKTIKVDGKSIYISKKKIDECQKEGGLLPLATLIPVIAGVASATAGIVKTVNDKRASDEDYAEQKRHNLEVEKALKSGSGLKEHIKKFVQATDLEGDSKKVVKKFLKNLSDVIEVRAAEGSGLYLNPYRK